MTAKVTLKGGEMSLLNGSEEHTLHQVFFYLGSQHGWHRSTSYFKTYKSAEEISVSNTEGSRSSKNLEMKVKGVMVQYPKTERFLQVALVCPLGDSEFEIASGRKSLLLLHGKWLDGMATSYPGAILRIRHADLRMKNRMGTYSVPLTADLIKTRNWLRHFLMEQSPPPGGFLNAPASDGVIFMAACKDFHDHNHEFLTGECLKSLGSLEIEVVLPENIPPTLEDLNGKMLEDKDNCNFVIVAGDGTEHFCHRSFLTVNSDVFHAMIGNKVEFGGNQSLESQTGRLVIKEMSGEVIQAFLEYLYTQKIDWAMASSLIALELLMAGHKYNIKCLEDAMKALILSWPTGWDENCLEMASRLYLFARNVDDLSDLRVKAVEVLCNNETELLKSNWYERLIEENLLASFDLCLAAMLGL